MFLQMDFNTENTVLSGAEHEIKNACLRLLSVNYEINSGVHINLGVFSHQGARRPILSLQYNISRDSDNFRNFVSSEFLNGKSFLESFYGYLLTLPEFENAKSVNDV
jgi:hypothetical protein